MSSTVEEWRPFDTGNLVIPGYEVSSLGRVRKSGTGEVLVLEDRSSKDVSPHYCVCQTYWRPEVLIKVIFAKKIDKPVVTKIQATDWDSVVDENYSAPKQRLQSNKVTWVGTSKAKDKVIDPSPVVRRLPVKPIVAPETVEVVPEIVELQPEIIEARSAELELAEMLYKPYKHEKSSDAPSEQSTPPQIQTTKDRMAQRVSVNRQKLVHGTDRVLRLYKTSAFKRGYVWELTDEKAISLMVSSCHYCGCEPGTHNQNGLNGIDRIINADGYVDGNVVPCCGKCNMMKGKRDPDEFIGHVFSIAEHQREALTQTVA